MKIKDDKRSLPGDLHKILKERLPKKRWLRYVFASFLLFIVASISFLGGAYTYHVMKQTGRLANLRFVATAKLAILPHWFQGLSARPDHISISISHLNLQKLHYNRQIAMKRGLLLPDCRDEVPVTIIHGGKRLRAKVRLKGDLADHWGDKDKWSFRVTIIGEKRLLGMKKFSLQHPKTRGYLNEWVFHQFLKYNGLISLRYNFVEVDLNGKNWGIFAIEEHFGKELPENNGQPDAPIIKFHEEAAISNFDGEIDVFQHSRILEDHELTRQFHAGKDLLEGFRQGRMKTSEVFDIRKLAILLATTDLFGHHHATLPSNIRFYYNPILSLLEPIGYDYGTILDLAVERTYLENLHNVPDIKKRSRFRNEYRFRDEISSNRWFHLLFDDPLFVREYIRTLEAFAAPGALERFFSATSEEFRHTSKIVYKGFPNIALPRHILWSNRKYIRRLLNPKRGLNVYVKEKTDRSITLELGNTQVLPLEVLSISSNNGKFLYPGKKLIIPPKDGSKPIHFILASFDISPSAPLEDLTVNYGIVGLNFPYQEKVHPYSHLDDDFLEKFASRKRSDLPKSRFLEMDVESGEILIKPGNWDISQDIIIPGGYHVTVEEGTQLNLTGGRIISHSPMDFHGSSDHPIIVTSNGSAGQGIVLLRTGRISYFKYTSFSNLTDINEDGWNLKGAIVAYEAPLELHGCLFRDGNGNEAYLRIMRSEFTVDKCIFRDIAGTALDAEYSQGSIATSLFEEMGNTAIKSTGSVLDLEDVIIKGCGTAGLSLGGRSTLRAKKIDIRRSDIAISSRDESKINLIDTELSDGDIGLALFQTKFEFGPPSVIASKLSTSNMIRNFMVEEGATLIVNGKAFTEKENDVHRLLSIRKDGS